VALRARLDLDFPERLFGDFARVLLALVPEPADVVTIPNRLL
jgi:hypothetical protein